MHKCSEVIHTNQRHSFLTTEYGFVLVSQLTLGMQVLNADGTVETVTGWKVVPGTQVMYNLEVAQDHTYTVGAGQWVVHNCAYGGNNPFAQRGNQFHYDMQNGGPAQLQQIYPQTEFEFQPRGAAGADVHVTGGVHPSDTSVYPGTNWPVGSDYADFRPDTPRGRRQFNYEIHSGKLPPDTVPIWYNQALYRITGIGR